MKKAVILTAALCMTAAAFAYNPPVGGEYVYNLTSPEMISGGASASGGAEFNIVPASIVFNPAVTAGEQRTVADLSATLLINEDKQNYPGYDDSAAGFGFQMGMIVPTRYTVLTGTIQGLFCDFTKMNLRDTVSIHLGSAKEVLEKQLYVGMNIYGGFYFGDDSDFTVGADLGALYFFSDDLLFMKNARIGASFLNLGKPLNTYETFGVKNTEGIASKSDYPGAFTPRVSFGATLFTTRNVDGYFSTDVSFPNFHNAVFDVSYGMSFFNLINLTTSWSCNVLEFSEKDYGAAIPTIGINFKFVINSGKLGREDWAQSEITPSFAYQKLYESIDAFSLGAKVNLGMKDTTAPEIILWDEE